MKAAITIISLFVLLQASAQTTVTRNPTSDLAVAGTWSGSADTRYTLVDDHPDSGGSDFITGGTTSPSLITFGFTAFSIPTNAINISVTVDYFDRKNASQGNSIQARLYISGAYYAATAHNTTNGSWVLRSDTWNTNPATSAAWTPTDINTNLTAFGLNLSDANPAIDISSIQISVTYTLSTTKKGLPLIFYK